MSSWKFCLNLKNSSSPIIFFSGKYTLVVYSSIIYTYTYSYEGIWNNFDTFTNFNWISFFFLKMYPLICLIFFVDFWLVLLIDANIKFSLTQFFSFTFFHGSFYKTGHMLQFQFDFLFAIFFVMSSNFFRAGFCFIGVLCPVTSSQ